MFQGKALVSVAVKQYTSWSTKCDSINVNITFTDNDSAVMVLCWSTLHRDALRSCKVKKPARLHSLSSTFTQEDNNQLTVQSRATADGFCMDQIRIYTDTLSKYSLI